MKHLWFSLFILQWLACIPVLAQKDSCTEEEMFTYILDRKPESLVTVCGEPKSVPGIPELEMWKLVRDTDVVSDVQAFIDTFPDSTLAPAAWLRLKQLAQKSRITTSLLLDEQSQKSWTEPITGMTFRRIPGNCYNMGSPVGEAGRRKNEGVHLVCVSSFWMGVHEVTNAQYRKFKPEHHNRPYRGKSLNKTNQPAAYVSWITAKAYVQWLTDQHKHRYNFRLPSEAEWEYACRAGTFTARPWGNNFDPKRLNFSDVTNPLHPLNKDFEDGYIVSAPVGQYPPNPFGLYDMLGNVLEWVEDRYGDYKNHQNLNSLQIVSGGYRVLRGGSWGQHPENSRCARRMGSFPSDRLNIIGFRIVRNP